MLEKIKMEGGDCMTEQLQELSEKYSFWDESEDIKQFDGSSSCNCGGGSGNCSTCSSGCQV